MDMVQKMQQSSAALVNDGALSCFFVGTGSAFSRRFYQTNILIVKGGTHVLIDCGTRCSCALAEYGCAIEQIQNYIITHSHADHIGGLEEAALLGMYMSRSRPRMLIPDEYRDVLWNESLRGGLMHSEQESARLLTFHDYFEQITPLLIADTPRRLYHIEFGGIDFKLFRTIHIPDRSGSWENGFISYGVLVDNRVLFTGDTRYDAALLDWLCGAYPIEYIFHDCQLYTGGVHASYQELQHLPAAVKQKMFLCHYGDAVETYNACADGFAGFAEQGCFYVFD